MDDELKPCSMGTKQAAEKLQESYDYMARIMPEGKRSQATIDILAAMLCAINALRRAAPENKLNISEISVAKAIQRVKDLIGILDIRIGWGDATADILSEKRDYELAISALQNYAPQPENKPLTLEQLRQMDGDPVWIADAEVYGILSVERDGLFVYGEYGSGIQYCWSVKKRKLKLYARKPEGSA